MAIGIAMQLISLRGFGLLGMIMFIPLFLFTFADPQLVERSGKAFIEWKLQSETDNKIDSIHLPAPSNLEKILGKKAELLRSETEIALEEIKRQLKADVPAILAAQIAKVRDLDCECRKFWESKLRDSMLVKVASLETAKEKIIEFGHAKYMEIVGKLTLDVRIFLGTNAAIFVLLFAVSFMKPMAIKHLFLPGGLMLISTVVCSYFYLFEQNWFYTIIYNDYTGYSYMGYLTFVFVILCDIIFNKARVTTEVINAFLGAIGHAAVLVPC